MNKKPLTIVSVVPNLAPVRVVIALDASTSMTNSARSWGENLNAAEELLKQLPASSPAGLVVFSDDPETLIPLTANRDVIRGQLEQFRPRHDKMHATAIWDGLVAAAAFFGAPQPGDTIYLISDGADDASRHKLDAAQNDLWARGIRVFMLFLGPEMKDEKRRDSARQLVRDSGGLELRVLEEPKKKSSAEEREAIADIARSALLAQQFRTIWEFDILRVELPQPVHEPVRWDLKPLQRGAGSLTVLFPRALPACPVAPK